MTEYLHIILGVANLIVVSVGGLLLHHFFPKYLEKKAENLATKEDIGKITREIEKVKAECAAHIESIRAALGSQLYIHQTRYEKEFEIFTELTAKLVELRDAAQGLRPMLDSIN